jgi:hypothetical protein
MPVLRSGDAQCGALGDRPSEELDERGADADVRHAPGREKELQGCLLEVRVKRLSLTAAVIE